jgi:hypothetical protein
VQEWLLAVGTFVWRSIRGSWRLGVIVLSILGVGILTVAVAVFDQSAWIVAFIIVSYAAVIFLIHGARLEHDARSRTRFESGASRIRYHLWPRATCRSASESSMMVQHRPSKLHSARSRGACLQGFPSLTTVTSSWRGRAKPATLERFLGQTALAL